MCQTSTGAWQFKYIPAGQAFTFKPSTYVSYQLAPLYVDWSTTADNVGTLFVDIFKNATTSISNEDLIVQAFSLKSNYPNPFNPTTTIPFWIPVESNVELSVFNLLGQKVATLVSEVKRPGSHEVRFDATTLTSGVYLYRLHAGEFVETRRLMLIK